MPHAVAEGNVHVAALELAGQAAAVEGRDGVGTVGRGAAVSIVVQPRRRSAARGEAPTCTSAVAWGRPPCSGSICKASEHYRQTTGTDPAFCWWTKEKCPNVLHEVPFAVVGQNPGDVPVSRGQGLKYVRAGVGLGGQQKAREHPGQTRPADAVRPTAQLLTMEVDMEMWKNFPLPP